MSEQIYSPSVAAALKKNANLRAVTTVTSPAKTIPHPTSPASWKLLHLDPFETVPLTPPKPLRLPSAPTPTPMYEELVETMSGLVLEQGEAERIGVGAQALWAGTLRNINQPDAVDNALVRIDALEERSKRYRTATASSREMMLKFNQRNTIGKTVLISPGLDKRIAEAAMTRGENGAECLRFLIECGLILLDERARRYEAWMIAHAQDTAQWSARDSWDREEARGIVAGVLAQIEPKRYVYTQRGGVQQARELIDGLAGAPASVRRVIESSAGVSLEELSA